MADPLIEALRSGKLAGVRAAIKADPAGARRPRAVVEAGRLAFQQALELLEHHGADLNASHRGYRPLHSLLQEKPHGANGDPAPERLACLEWLLAHGADPEQAGAWPPARALIVAAFTGQPRYVEILREAGAFVDGFVAAALGKRKRVEYELRKRPEFACQRDPHGLTALQCAAGSRLPNPTLVPIARLLLDAGAEIGARTKSWRHDIDAVYLAASSKNKPLFDMLLERGADPTEALVPALWNAGLTFAESCLARGADPNRAVCEGRPLLNELIRWGQLRQVFWLIERGADPNLPDARGWTAVHQAASRGNERMWRAVLQAGGDAGRRDARGDTPLDVAKAMRRSTLTV